MAQILRLADVDASNTYDFLTGSLLFKNNTWRTTLGRDGTVIETVQLVARTTDANTIAAAVSIDDFAKLAELFIINKYTDKSVWFEYKATSETAKRALVYKIELYPIPRGKFTPLLGETGAIYQLIITRDAAWEDMSVTTLTHSNISTVGGQNTIAAIKGTLAGRIESVRVIFDTGAVATVWVGYRPTGPGVTNYTPLWELEDGTAGTDTALATDATASPGGGGNTKMDVTWSNTTMQERVGIIINDVSASNEANFVGRYLVLLRCKQQAGSTVVYVKMVTGFQDTTALTQHEVKEVSHGTSYRYVELGEVDIPGYPYRSVFQGDKFLENFEIQIHAERYSGASTILSLDCLVLIPSEHYFKLEGLDLQTGSPYVYKAGIFVMEDGEVYSTNVDNNEVVVRTPTQSYRDLSLPVEGAVLVVAGERSTVQNISDILDLQTKYYPRHRTHREA